MTRAVFVAVGVYNWNIVDPTKATFSLNRDGTNPIEMDHSKRPEGGAATGSAIIDDEQFGATTVSGTVADGGLYVEMKYALQQNLPLPPTGYRGEAGGAGDYLDRSYEFMTIQYQNDDAGFAGRRYYGFHAIWIAGDRDRAVLLLFHAGDSRSATRGAVERYTVDLDDARLVLPESEMPRGSLPKPGDVAGGGIFLRCVEVYNLKLLLPKLPQALHDYMKVPTCTPQESRVRDIGGGGGGVA